MAKAEAKGVKLLLPVDVVVADSFPDPIDGPIDVTTVAAERLILGLVWKFGKPSKNKRPMGFCAKSKWIEDHYRLSKNTISRAYTSLKDKGYIQKVGDGSWMLNYAAIYRAAIENAWEPPKL